jgi:hypothetical protein
MAWDETLTDWKSHGVRRDGLFRCIAGGLEYVIRPVVILLLALAYVEEELVILQAE